MKTIIFATMYLVMCCHIVFAETKDRQAVEFTKIESASGSGSWKNLTATATIRLASSIYFQGKKTALKDLIKAGDPVQIFLGYGGDLDKRFDGFVSSVSPSIPVEIKCEDYMYKLKRTAANFSYASIRLPQMLKNICPSEISLNAADIDVGTFKASNANVAKVLEKLKEQYGTMAYIRDNTLVCGKVYMANINKRPVATFYFQHNIKKDHTLVYRNKDEVLFDVEAISNLRSGKKIKVKVGDSQGEQRTLNFFNIESEDELRETATREMERLKYDGWSGEFNTFGKPFIQHSDVITISDSDYPEKDGNYFVDQVDWSFKAPHYNQKLVPGKKVV